MVLNGILWYFRTPFKNAEKNVELLCSYSAPYRSEISETLRNFSRRSQVVNQNQVLSWALSKTKTNHLR